MNEYYLEKLEELVAIMTIQEINDTIKILDLEMRLKIAKEKMIKNKEVNNE